MTILEEANFGFQDAWKAQCQRLPNGVVSELPGVAAAFGRVPVSFLNMFLPDSPIATLDDLNDRISQILQYPDAERFPWLFPICQEWAPQGFEKNCLERGLVPALELTAMAADRLAPQDGNLPELEFVRVEDEAMAWQIADINCKAYALPDEFVETLATIALWDETTFPYVGLADGEPVTCSATLIIGNLLYVGWVATRPGHQKKGYAEAVMRHSLEKAQAATGLSRTLLHATAAGFKLYESMGYKTTANFVVFTKAT